MAYIGNSYQQQNIVNGTDFFSGNGQNTIFTLTKTPLSSYNIEVVVNNVQQNPNNAYSLSGNTLTFTGAPSTGTNNIYVVYSSLVANATNVSPGTIGPTQLANKTGQGSSVLSQSPTLEGRVEFSGVPFVSTLPFWESTATIRSNYTVTTGSNAMTIGPVTIANGVTVTVPDGSTWTVV